MRAAFAIFSLLAGCATTPPQSVYKEESRSQPQSLTERPFYSGYGEAIGVQPVHWTARSIARDFDRLMFQTEWGESVPRLLKWEKPATISLSTPELASYRPFLDDLVTRIRNAAPGLDVSATGGPNADITLRSAPRTAMDEIAANALCFFIPYDVTWAEFKSLDARDAAGWSQISILDKITVFIPAFAAPHEIRSCILEEVTQALGPGNDLRYLNDSIFNDDNAHVWPTGFDRLILRTLYNDTLRNGLNSDEAAIEARSVLESEPLGGLTRTIDLIGSKYDTALMIAENETDFVLRKQALQAAISLAKTQGAAPHRLGEAYKTAAFVAFEANDPDRVVDYLSKAELAHARALAANSVHLARVRSELAINLINLENHDTGLALLELAEPVFAANGSDWQLTHALRWRAIALSQLGRWAEASGTALEALDWARYVYRGGSRAVASWRQEFVDIGLIPASG